MACWQPFFCFLKILSIVEIVSWMILCVLVFSPCFVDHGSQIVTDTLRDDNIMGLFQFGVCFAVQNVDVTALISIK